jgi:hypothetical protein
MSELKWVAGINLAILLIYSLLIRVVSGVSEGQLTILVASAFAIGVQVIFNIFVSIVFFIMRKNELGKSFLVGSALVLVLGFSVCMGNALLFQ